MKNLVARAFLIIPAILVEPALAQSSVDFHQWDGPVRGIKENLSYVGTRLWQKQVATYFGKMWATCDEKVELGLIKVSQDPSVRPPLMLAMLVELRSAYPLAGDATDTQEILMTVRSYDFKSSRNYIHKPVNRTEWEIDLCTRTLIRLHYYIPQFEEIIAVRLYANQEYLFPVLAFYMDNQDQLWDVSIGVNNETGD